MSGSTHSIDASGNTAGGNNNNNFDDNNDNVIWSDNPEREYFQSLMNERFAERVEQGRMLSTNDSLIGDSTMASILEGNDHGTLDGDVTTTDNDNDYDGNDDDDDDLPSYTFSSHPLHGRGVGGDGDTIDNIEEAGSIVAWFRNNRDTHGGGNGSISTGISSRRQYQEQQNQQQQNSLEYDADADGGTTLESSFPDGDIHRPYPSYRQGHAVQQQQQQHQSQSQSQPQPQLQQQQQQQQQLRPWTQNHSMAENNDWVDFNTDTKSKQARREKGRFGFLKQKKKQQEQQQSQQEQQSQQQPLPPSPPPATRPLPPQNNIAVDHEVPSGAMGEIPGFIIVTSGHSSSVQTRGITTPNANATTVSNELSTFSAWGPSQAANTKTKSVDGDGLGDYSDNKYRTWVWGRRIVVMLLLLVLAVSVALAIIVTQRKNDQDTTSQSNGSSQSADGGSLPTNNPFPPSMTPTPVPQVTVSPTTSPADFFEMTAQPTNSPGSTSSPTSSIDVSETFSPTVQLAEDGSPSDAPTSSTTQLPSASPSSNTLETIISRLSLLSPGSVSAWSDPNTPQRLALDWLSSDSSATAYSDRQLQQRYSLATLYYATNGESSSVSTSWLDQGSECGWTGVECFQNRQTGGDVRVLRLIRMNLSGEIPPEIELLSDTLREIFLSNNNISGTLPSSISRLSNLRRLNLPGNSIVGSIPPEIGDLGLLEVLSTKNNEMTGTIPTTLGRLTSLATLDLGKNIHSGTIPVELSGMTNIARIYLTDNPISGTVPEELDNLESLDIFVVKGTNLSGSMPFGLCGLNELSADCGSGGSYSCECCTECCIDGARCVVNTMTPTFSPTVALIPDQTTSPTSSPVAGIPTLATTTTVPTVQPSLIADGDDTTSDPTLPATIVPSDSPTISPTENDASPASPVASPSSPEDDTITCNAAISTDRDCYENGDDIIVSFTNCDETRFDWIGVWPSQADPFNLVSDPLAWVWSCGDQLCNEATAAGEAIFYNARGSGSFRIFLLRSGDSNEGPFLSYAASEEFFMAQQCV